MEMKTLNRILSNMVNWIRASGSQITNFSVGSVIRTFLEAVAMEIESMYFQMHKGFQWAIENAIYNSFSFAKLPAVAASGELYIEFQEALSQRFIIQPGTRFSTTTTVGTRIIYFEAVEEKIVFEGDYETTIKVRCTEPGIIGNVSAYAVRLPVIYEGVYKTIYNPKAFTNGAEEETPEARKKRFGQYITTRAKGTIDAIKYGTMEVQATEEETEAVAGVHVVDNIGSVDVYAHDVDGELSEELRARIESNLENYRAAGIEVNVQKVEKIEVDLEIKITLSSTIFNEALYSNLIQNSVTQFLNSFTVSKSLTRAELIKHIMNINEGAIVNVTTNLESDIVNNTYKLIRAGVIEVEISYL